MSRFGASYGLGSAVLSALLVIQQAGAESAAPCSGTCTYTLKADFTWSEARFPIDYPAASAHWSPLASVAHDDTFTMWRQGEIANAGIQTIAELGATGPFNEEVEACGTSCGDALAFECSPFSGVCVAEGEIEVDPERPYVSAASMLAPSPDWFVGLDSVNLCEEGSWVEEFEQDVFVLDSGTDSGITYLAPDEVTSPKAPIDFIAGPAAAIFSTPEADPGSVGIVKLVKMQCVGEGERTSSSEPEPAEGATTETTSTSTPPSTSRTNSCHTPAAMLAAATGFILLLL